MQYAQKRVLLISATHTNLFRPQAHAVSTELTGARRSAPASLRPYESTAFSASVFGPFGNWKSRVPLYSTAIEGFANHFTYSESIGPASVERVQFGRFEALLSSAVGSIFPALILTCSSYYKYALATGTLRLTTSTQSCWVHSAEAIACRPRVSWSHSSQLCNTNMSVHHTVRRAFGPIEPMLRD